MGAVEVEGVVIPEDQELEKGKTYKTRVGKTRFGRLRRKGKPSVIPK
jgi:hypothetical protein